MLFWLHLAQPSPLPVISGPIARRRTQSVVTAFMRQDFKMTNLKRLRWTEADILALPAGEHDIFERKGGELFNDRGDFLATLGKALSAFANSGGGHLILGVGDTGVIDGLPQYEGRTSIRDWLEQMLPNLVVYPLSDFRVHIVERSTPSQIPLDREVIVIDIGDSPLAPHQCARSGKNVPQHTYYHRRGGRSHPAPHFYLELLRQRLVSPTLEISEIEIRPWKVTRNDDVLFLAMNVRFTIENTSQVAAYRWGIRWLGGGGLPEERLEDYHLNRDTFPSGFNNNIPIKTVDTILPGLLFIEEKDLGVFLRPSEQTPEAIRLELENLLIPISLMYRLATETSRGEDKEIQIGGIVNIQELLDFIIQKIRLP